MKKLVKIELNNGTLELKNVPSEFGNVSYYGLLRSIVKQMNVLIDYENYDREFIDKFVKEVNEKIQTLEEDYSLFKSESNRKYLEFTTELTSNFEKFKIDSLESQTRFENEMNDIINTFKTSMENEFRLYKESITLAFNNLSDEFTDLKVFVTNYLTSDEFTSQIEVEVNKYLSAPEFKEFINQVISEQISSNNVVKKTDIASKTDLGVVKVGDNVTFNDNKIDVNIASKSDLGIVKVGTNVYVRDGELSVPIADSDEFGVVKVGTNIGFENSVLDVNIGSKSDLGIVLAGTNIDVSHGELSVPVAKNDTLGVVKPDGTSINVNSNGVLSAIGSTVPGTPTFKYMFDDALFTVEVNQTLSVPLQILYNIVGKSMPINLGSLTLKVVGYAVYRTDISGEVSQVNLGSYGKLYSGDSSQTTIINMNCHIYDNGMPFILNLYMNNPNELVNGGNHHHKVEIAFQVL